ncbi:biosynthetic-type acetolactate synthase large subunit [Natrarchaeobaculum aegyptiacum]|uniref:Acetolactate synthase n=1 Tax=Natrarchaeobaculum aegyptiacum TaxID=745377 RepID=A0A2Z2HPX8_9EURY|nr:biosynthetic-type acetolactate synthase large subunit [Natrarchaeobaculum aegyptiacum]ARS88633.1 acetolactate synthase, large subunit, biosynthetic type [Natrarchaeobaculum aegyptiacum]
MSERAASVTPDETDEQDDDQHATTETELESEREAADSKPAPVTTGAEAVVRALENAGVEYAFGVQGGAIMPVYDALFDSDIYHVTMAHEQGASHAADAYGIVSGEPGVCLATSGPGATNLVTGIADADMDSDPMVALTGQVPTAFVGNDAFQETDTTGVTAPVTKDNTFSTDPDRVGTDVSEAFALAREGRPGPTLVDLPKDVTKSETEREPDGPAVPETYHVQERADPEIVAAAAERIENASRPVMLLGGGVIKGEASDVCREFAIDHEIPVITTMPGLGAFPEDHELSLEMAGMHGTGYANMAISLTDTLIAVGTRFDDRLTGGIETFAPDAEVIHVDIDPAEISKNIHADYPLVGDAGTVVSQLAEAVTESPRATKWRAQCQQWKSDYSMAYQTPDDAPVQPEFVVEALDEATSDQAIVTTGVGQHQMWACQYWTFTEPRTWVSSHGLGTMGYGLPAAIGARLAADDDQEVVCIDGDGSFLMTLQELSVAVRENLDITVAVLNNEYIGMVRQWQDAFFEGRHAASDYHWMPEFDKLAEAFGAQGFRIDEYDEVPDTIEEALAYDGPSVIDVHIDPAANVYPMVPSGGDNNLFALTEDQL